MSAIDTVFAERSLLGPPGAEKPSSESLRLRPARLGVLAILLLALTARLAVLGKFSEQLGLDPDLYGEIARHLANGEGFATDRGLTAFRPPLYPLLLATIFKAGGNLLAAGLVHAALGVATTWVTIRLGYRLGLGHAALGAGLLVAVDPLLLQATALVMTETLATFLASGVLFCLMRPPEKWRPGEAFFDGLPLGLAILCRPTFAAFALCWFVGAVLIALFSARRSREPGTARRRVFALICTLLGVGITLLPWGWRNQIVFGRFETLTTHGGYTLLLGHNEDYYERVVRQPWGTVWGDGVKIWQAKLEQELAAAKPPLDLRPGQPVNEFGRDRWMREKALENIRTDPGMALRSSLTLVGRFWNLTPMGGSGAELPTALRWGIGGFYGLTFLAALVGVWRLTRADWHQYWPALALIASFTLVHTMYWSDMRMRAPLVPALALLAANCRRVSPKA